VLYHFSHTQFFLLTVIIQIGSLNFCPGPVLNLDLPISTSQIAGITGMYHHTWPESFLFNYNLSKTLVSAILLFLNPVIDLSVALCYSFILPALLQDALSPFQLAWPPSFQDASSMPVLAIRLCPRLAPLPHLPNDNSSLGATQG
jgi:hypothetical protein